MAAAMLMCWVFVLNHNKVFSNDTWWHLEMGRWIVENARVPTEEIYSFTAAGKAFEAYEWLCQVIFHLIADTDAVFLSWFKLGLMLAGSWAIGWIIIRPYWLGAFTFPLLMALAYLMAFRAHVRPQIFGMWCSVVLIYGLMRWQQTRSLKSIWWVIPSQILWVNTHGSYLLSPFLVAFVAGLIWVSAQWPLLPGDQTNPPSRKAGIQLAGLAVLLGLVSLINPYGYKLIEKSASIFFTHNYMKDYIREWYSITTIEPGYWYYVWAAWIFTGWLLLATQRRKVTALDLGLMALATWFPFSGTRYVTLSALLSLPVILKYTFELRPRGFAPKVWIVASLPLVLYVGAMGNPYSADEYLKVGSGFSYGQVPRAIIQHIKAHNIQGRMMNSYDDGAFVLYYLYPEVRAAIDSRTDVYGETLYKEHHHAYDNYKVFTEYLDKYDIDLVLTKISNETLRQELFRDKAWHLEKSGMNHDLFRRASSMRGAQPSVGDRSMLQKPIDDQKRHCLFVRLYGLCMQDSECATECSLVDTEIAALLQLPNSECLKYAQACFKAQTCGNCRALCAHYKQAIPEINRRFDLDLPDGSACDVM